MTEIYLDLLDAERKKIFRQLKILANEGTLAGGTALSLQLKHRYSVDFDIFFRKPVIRKAFTKISKRLGIKAKRVDLSHHITFLTPAGIRITLFHYEFSPLYPPVKTLSLPLFDFKDIAADKAYTLGRRPIWRDYVDLFFLLKDKHASLRNIIDDAKRKFKNLFEPKLFLEQLTYYDDIRNFKIKFIKKKYSIKEIQSFLKEQFRQHLKQKL